MGIADLTNDVVAYLRGKTRGNDPFVTPVRGLTAVFCDAPTTFAHVAYKPIFCLVLQGVKAARIGGRELTFGEAESLIVTMELPASSRIVEATPDQPYVALALELEPEIVRELAVTVGEPEPAHPRSAASTMATGKDIIDGMRRLFSLLSDNRAQDALRPLIVRELYYWLLASAHGPMLRSLGNVESHSSRISLAISEIRSRFAMPLRIADLARLAGMSESSFYENFKIYTGTTPLQFQKHLRLVEARNLLAGGSHSVGSVAYEVGYESSTQFSREYSRQFGSPPRQDLRGSRGSRNVKAISLQASLLSTP
jgi:AraC-like DNA-binding protein